MPAVVLSGLPQTGEVFNSVPEHRFSRTGASAPTASGSPRDSRYEDGAAVALPPRTLPGVSAAGRYAVTLTAGAEAGLAPTAGHMHSTRPQYGQTGTMDVMPCTMPS